MGAKIPQEQPCGLPSYIDLGGRFQVVARALIFPSLTAIGELAHIGRRRVAGADAVVCVGEVLPTAAMIARDFTRFLRHFPRFRRKALAP